MTCISFCRQRWLNKSGLHYSHRGGGAGPRRKIQVASSTHCSKHLHLLPTPSLHAWLPLPWDGTRPEVSTVPKKTDFGRHPLQVSRDVQTHLHTTRGHYLCPFLGSYTASEKINWKLRFVQPPIHYLCWTGPNRAQKQTRTSAVGTKISLTEWPWMGRHKGARTAETKTECTRHIYHPPNNMHTINQALTLGRNALRYKVPRYCCYYILHPQTMYFLKYKAKGSKPLD